MSKKPTMVDVAKSAGVSLGTVSKVMNGHTGVGSELRDKVSAAAQQLGYAHNMVAASLRRQSTHSVGVLLPDLRNTFFAEFVELFEEAAAQSGYSVIIMTSGEDKVRAREKLRAMIRRRVDGLVVIPALSLDVDPVASLDTPMPAVLVDRVDSQTTSPSVATNGEQGAYEGTKYLISIGHKQIAFATVSDQDGNAKERVDGFLRAMSEHPELKGDVVVTGTSVEQVRSVLARLLSQRQHTALFTASNPVTLGGLKAINDCGLVYPQDLSLLAFDDFDWLTLVPPFISAVRQPVEKIAAEAWHKLLAEMSKEKQPQRHVRFDADLIVRHSTQALLVAD